MKKTEAFKGLIDRLNPIFGTKEFKSQKSKNYDFFKKTDYGFCLFFIRVLDYNPIQKFEFASAIDHSSVSDIIDTINEKFNLVKVFDIKTTLVWGYPFSLGSSVNKCQVSKEEDFDKCIKYIQMHLDKYVFPFYERFAFLSNIDKEINNEFFWKTDWKMPYSMRELFPFKRTIIAHLCSNPRINEIRAYHIKEWEDALIKYPDCKNLLLAYDYLFEYLKDISPLNISNNE